MVKIWSVANKICRRLGQVNGSDLPGGLRIQFVDACLGKPSSWTMFREKVLRELIFPVRVLSLKLDILVFIGWH